MEFDCEPIHASTISLLSTVHEGNLDLLENYFLTIPNPNEYLDQIYDYQFSQKCSLLTIACLNEHIDIMRMLIRQFKPNLEVKNDVLFTDSNKNRHMCFSVSVLWVATANNNFDMVKLLVEHGADVNHTTKTNSTPLRSACYNGNLDLARYLIENGADVHIAKENNDTNLAISVYRGHLNMASYLVNELGCDVNVCDNDGRTPLYDAVNGGWLELVQFLLDHGARNFPATCDQMTPLMWAAEKRRSAIVHAIASHGSLMDKIEAEELLGSAFICSGNGGYRSFEQAYEHFKRALELRTIYKYPKVLLTKTKALFDNRQELQTIQELDKIYLNQESLRIEALLVRERLLGPKNTEYRYSLRYHGAILADNHQHNQALAFWMYELELHEEHSIPVESESLRHFISLFSQMVRLSLPIPIEHLLKIIKFIVHQLRSNVTEFDYNLDSLLFLITIISKLITKTNMSCVDRQAINQCLCFVIKQNYVKQHDGSSLLHLSLNKNTPIDEYFIEHICKYPCLETARTLLRCGADVNAFNTMRNTPLHVFLHYSNVHDDNLLELLCDAGAHLDYVNILRETPIDATSNLADRQLVKSKMKLKLKCLCARLIQVNNIPFHEKLTSSLVQFVEKH